MRFHHVAMAATDIEDALFALSSQGPVRLLTDAVSDPEQGVRLQLVDVGGLQTELVQDEGDGPVAGWLNRGCKLYHICYEVDDLNRAVEEARLNGAVVVSYPKPALLFSGRRVAFVMDRVRGLVEFLEKG
jgi:methylmalonyl-CoA/ethylmalonyl-CoA epimerase